MQRSGIKHCIVSNCVVYANKKAPLIGLLLFLHHRTRRHGPGLRPPGRHRTYHSEKGTYRCEKTQKTGISLEKTPVKDYNVNYGFVCSAQANVSLWIRREAITLSRKTIPEKIHFVCCILKLSREGGVLCAIEFTMSA